MPLRGPHFTRPFALPARVCEGQRQPREYESRGEGPRGIYPEALQPLGYGLKAEIVEWPESLPGEAGLFLTWK